MQRITTVLRESEAMAVRKAVFSAGGENVVISPLSCREGSHETLDIYSDETIASESARYVRIDVTADNNQSDCLVSAIRSITHSGRILLARHYDRKDRRIV